MGLSASDEAEETSPPLRAFYYELLGGEDLRTSVAQKRQHANASDPPTNYPIIFLTLKFIPPLPTMISVSGVGALFRR